MFCVYLIVIGKKGNRWLLVIVRVGKWLEFSWERIFYLKKVIFLSCLKFCDY